MRVSFKDFSGMGVEGELEFLIPYLNNSGKIHNLCVGVDFGNGSSMASSCIKLEDLSLWADEDEPRTLYPHDVVQKLKNEKARLKKENEQFYNDNEKLRKKLAEYEEEAKLQKELAKMKQIVINSEQAQKLSDYVNNLHNVVGELKFIPLNEIPIIHLNSFEDCQKLEAEPIKADDSQTKKFAPPFTSVSKVEMYSSDGEKIAETKTNKPDNYDEIINRLLKFRTRVQHEHIQFRNGLLELIDIVLKLAREVQGDERKAN